MAGSSLRNLNPVCHEHICKHVPIQTELLCWVWTKLYGESSITTLTKELSKYLGLGFFWTVFFWNVSRLASQQKCLHFTEPKILLPCYKIALHRFVVSANQIQCTLWKISIRLMVRLSLHLLQGTQALRFPIQLMYAFISPMHSTWTASFLYLQLTNFGISA
jgi:hypothetical protein